MRNTRSLSRQEQIMHILARHATASVEDLAAALGVSGWTIRRDLDQLAERNLVQRRYGAATLTDAPENDALLWPIAEPDDSRGQTEAKRRIGQAAAHLIPDGKHIVVGAGSTTTQVARALKQRRQLVVFTNGLNIALELAGVDGIAVTCTGGDVEGGYYTLTGPVTDRALRGHYFDIAVIGVSGITIEHGLTVNSQLNAIPLEIMVEHAQYVIVVAEHDKIGSRRFSRVAPIEAIDVLVTDAPLPPEYVEGFKEAGVELIVAE